MKNIENYNQDFASVWAAMDRTEKQMAESSAKLEKKIAETTANIDKYLAELKETRKEVGGLGKSYGMHAESYFLRVFEKDKAIWWHYI